MQAPYKILTHSFEMTGGSYCPLAIRMSWDALVEMGKDDEKWLHDTFKVCGPVKNSIADDLSDWLQSIWFNLGMGMRTQTSSFVLLSLM